MQVKTALARKCFNIEQLEECKDRIKPKWYEVSYTIFLPVSQYTYFINNLSEEYDWLKDKEGIIIVTDCTRNLVIDPQGYNYPRYIGLVYELNQEG